MLSTLKEVLGAAREGKYAVGAFNIVSGLSLSPLIKAAEKKRSPLILNVAEVSFEDCNVNQVSPSVVQAAKDATVPVVINLDHGVSDNGIQTALRNGFSSIMFDGSTLTYEENIAKTKWVVDTCHPLGVSVEAEIGHVGGGEAEAGEEQEVDTSAFTKIEEVEDFVAKTDVDALAVAIGNVHGFYKGEPQLQFELLKDIAAVSKVPLVLHGGSGISDDDFRKAASLGICKINFYTGLSRAVHENLLKYVKELDGKYVDFTSYCWNMMDSVQATAEDRMEVFGSAGKA